MEEGGKKKREKRWNQSGTVRCKVQRSAVEMMKVGRTECIILMAASAREAWNRLSRFVLLWNGTSFQHLTWASPCVFGAYINKAHVYSKFDRLRYDSYFPGRKCGFWTKSQTMKRATKLLSYPQDSITATNPGQGRGRSADLYSSARILPRVNLHGLR